MADKRAGILAALLGVPQGILAGPTPRPTLPTDANPESRLTAGQMTGLQYSRDRYADGSYQVDAPNTGINKGNPEAAITSFYGAVDQAPDGSWINYPTFWGGKVTDPKTALANALQYEQQTGKQFARYPTEQAANWGEMQMVHPIMDSDAQSVMATPESQARLRAMNLPMMMLPRKK